MILIALIFQKKKYQDNIYYEIWFGLFELVGT